MIALARQLNPGGVAVGAAVDDVAPCDVALVLCPVTETGAGPGAAPNLAPSLAPDPGALDTALLEGWMLLDACRRQGLRPLVLCCNRMIPAWRWPSRLHALAGLHAVSLEARELAGWLAAARASFQAVHATLEAPGVTHVWRSPVSIPSTGMLGVQVALALGAPWVVTNARLDAPGYDKYLPQWRHWHDAGRLERVRACSPVLGPSAVSDLLGVWEGWPAPAHEAEAVA